MVVSIIICIRSRTITHIVYFVWLGPLPGHNRFGAPPTKFNFSSKPPPYLCFRRASVVCFMNVNKQSTWSLSHRMTTDLNRICYVVILTKCMISFKWCAVLLSCCLQCAAWRFFLKLYTLRFIVQALSWHNMCGADDSLSTSHRGGQKQNNLNDISLKQRKRELPIYVFVADGFERWDHSHSCRMF